MKYLLKITLILIFCLGCKEEITNKKTNDVKQLKNVIKKQKISIKQHMVIAHRGTTYWAPEETEAAFLWARNIGADYLELDTQLTKDGVLIAFHDDILTRTTNVADVFSDKISLGIDAFTLKELRSLDAGSWFNTKNPDRARKGFVNLKIMTLQDVIMIAEGYRIKKKNGQPEKEIIKGNWNGKYLYEKDPNDNGNRPGIYVETKHPKSNIEKVLSKELTVLGWNINHQPNSIKTIVSKVGIANTGARVILQSFSPESIVNLEKELPNIPKCFLLWKPDMKGDLKEVYQKSIHFAVQNNVQIIGPSIAGIPNNYGELTALWMTDLIHSAGLFIHPYSFDTQRQLQEYKSRVEGVFTNRADLALIFYERKPKNSSIEILQQLGY